MDIELRKPHVHAGKVCPPGTKITLDDDLAKWLIDVGAAKPTDATATTDAPAHITLNDGAGVAKPAAVTAAKQTKGD